MRKKKKRQVHGQSQMKATLSSLKKKLTTPPGFPGLPLNPGRPSGPYNSKYDCLKMYTTKYISINATSLA